MAFFSLSRCHNGYISRVPTPEVGNGPGPPVWKDPQNWAYPCPCQSIHVGRLARVVVDGPRHDVPCRFHAAVVAADNDAQQPIDQSAKVPAVVRFGLADLFAVLLPERRPRIAAVMGGERRRRSRS